MELKLPEHLDKALRARARKQRKTLRKVTLEAIEAGVNLTRIRGAKRDLSGIAGTMGPDPELDAILESFRVVEPEREI